MVRVRLYAAVTVRHANLRDRFSHGRSDRSVDDTDYRAGSCFKATEAIAITIAITIAGRTGA